MIRRVVFVLGMCVSLSALTLLAGCGGSSEDTGDDSSEGASSQAAGETASASAPAAPTMASVAGLYELDKEKMKAAIKAEQEAIANDPDADPMQAVGLQMAAGFIDGMQMTITLNDDGTASSSMSMMGDTESGDGTWTLDGNSVAITIAMGDQQPETLSGSIDGTMLTMSDPSAEGSGMETMVFNRRAADAGAGDE